MAIWWPCIVRRKCAIGRSSWRAWKTKSRSSATSRKAPWCGSCPRTRTSNPSRSTSRKTRSSSKAWWVCSEEERRWPHRSVPMLLGLRSAFCYVDDIVAAKTWYSKVLGFAPYFDQPFYVGFNVGGYELGLSPDGGGPGNKPRAYGAYWGVKDVKAVYARLLELGAEP